MGLGDRSEGEAGPSRILLRRSLSRILPCGCLRGRRLPLLVPAAARPPPPPAAAARRPPVLPAAAARRRPPPPPAAAARRCAIR